MCSRTLDPHTQPRSLSGTEHGLWARMSSGESEGDGESNHQEQDRADPLPLARNHQKHPVVPAAAPEGAEAPSAPDVFHRRESLASSARWILNSG